MCKRASKTISTWHCYYTSFQLISQLLFYKHKLFSYTLYVLWENLIMHLMDYFVIFSSSLRIRFAFFASPFTCKCASLKRHKGYWLVRFRNTFIIELLSDNSFFMVQQSASVYTRTIKQDIIPNPLRELKVKRQRFGVLFPIDSLLHSYLEYCVANLQFLSATKTKKYHRNEFLCAWIRNNSTLTNSYEISLLTFHVVNSFAKYSAFPSRWSNQLNKNSLW